MRPARTSGRRAADEADLALVDARSLDCMSDEALAALWAILERAIAPDRRSIEVHLEGSGDADTRVLAVLVAAAARARGCGAELTIVAPARLRAFARVCRLDGILVLEERRPGRLRKRGNPSVTPPLAPRLTLMSMADR